MKFKQTSKIAFLLITIFTLFITIEKPLAQAANFKDVSSKAYYSEAVKSFVEKGYINGFADNTFRPDGRLTREQGAIILYRVLNLDKPRNTNEIYRDVPKEAQFFDEIMAISDLGIMSGYGDGTFKPNSPLTRGQMAIIISRTYELEKVKLKDIPFTDVKGTMYEIAVQKLYSAGITNGVTANTFAPNKPLTRGEFVTILHRTLQIVEKNTGFKKVELRQGSGNSIQVSGFVDEPFVNTIEITINQKAPYEKWILTNDYSVTNKEFNHSIKVPEAGEYEVTVTIKNTDISVIRSIVAGNIDKIITGVKDGGLYNSDITIEFPYGTGQLSRNGERARTYRSGTTISQDGDYVFSYQISQNETKEIHFIIDKTNPVVTGVEDGRTYYYPVNIRFDEGKAVLKTGKSRGSAFHSGTNVQEKGEYELVVTDAAGNETTVHFKLEPYDSEITGVFHNGVYKGNVKPSFKNGTATIRKNGGFEAPLRSGTSLSEEGFYYLTYTNSSGQTTSYYFEIDKTAPVISGVVNKGVYNPSAVIVYNEGVGMLQKDKGKTVYFPSGQKVIEPGNYVLTVADRAGNTSTVSFTIDTALPIVEGVVDKGVYNKPVTIKFNHGTATLKKDKGIEATIDSRTTVSAPGVYVLTVTGEKGKKVQLTFTIESDQIVAGVENNKVYNRSVTISFSNRTAYLSRNGGKEERIYSGRTISAEGSYVLTLIDRYNNKSIVSFTIDRTAPTKPGITIAGRTLHGSELILPDYTPVQVRISFSTTGSGKVVAGDKLSYRLTSGSVEQLNTEVTLTEADIKKGYKDFYIPADLLQKMISRTNTSYNCYIYAHLTDQAGNRSSTTSKYLKLTVSN